MDTYMTLTASGESANAAVSVAAQKLYELDAELSATDENSQIYAPVSYTHLTLPTT